MSTVTIYHLGCFAFGHVFISGLATEFLIMNVTSFVAELIDQDQEQDQDMTSDIMEVIEAATPTGDVPAATIQGKCLD